MFRKLLNSFTSPAAIILSTAIAFPSFATVVEFETSHGKFEVNLHDQTTPETVANFLEYVNDGFYNDTIIHRSAYTQAGEGFVIQGGGAKFEGVLTPTWLQARAPIINEPLYSNVVATIAMAKGNDVNSATSQWFINLSDNSFLDSNANGAFTVFGEVIGEGMNDVIGISQLARCNINVSGFTELPMPDYACDLSVPGAENYVTIISVTIVDPTENSASSLTPVMNTSLTTTPPTDNNTSSGSSGGSTTWLILSLLGMTSLFRKNSISKQL